MIKISTILDFKDRMCGDEYVKLGRKTKYIYRVFAKGRCIYLINLSLTSFSFQLTHQERASDTFLLIMCSSSCWKPHRFCPPVAKVWSITHIGGSMSNDARNLNCVKETIKTEGRLIKLFDFRWNLIKFHDIKVQ